MLRAISVLGIAYLIGSIPTAYLFVKWRYGADVRKSGSGNVGTLNALRVTGSRLLAAAVLLVDVLKGILIVPIAQSIAGESTTLIGSAVLAGVLGHLFPVWLRFHGGRGLAISAGILLFLTPRLVLIWLAIWIAGYLLLRKVVFASVLALAAMPVFIWWPHERFCPAAYAEVLTVLTAFLLLKHIPRLRDALTEKRLKSMA